MEDFSGCEGLKKKRRGEGNKKREKGTRFIRIHRYQFCINFYFFYFEIIFIFSSLSCYFLFYFINFYFHMYWACVSLLSLALLWKGLLWTSVLWRCGDKGKVHHLDSHDYELFLLFTGTARSLFCCFYLDCCYNCSYYSAKMSPPRLKINK